MNKIFQIDKERLIGASAIMLAALLWSLDGVFLRPKFYIFPAGLLVFLEHALGFLVLSPFIIIGWTKIKELGKKEWLAVFWVSIFGGVVGTIMITQAFFAAINGEVTFATVVILQKLQPFFALVMARLVLGERLNRRFYLWAVIAIGAAYFLAFGKTGLDISSVNLSHHAAFFALLAAFGFGSSTVFSKRLVNHLDFKSATALRFGVTGLLTLLLIIFTGEMSAIKEITALHWGYLVLIVFTSGAGAIFIYYFGLRKVTASTATICELFWPFSAVILDYILNRNVLNSIQIVSSLVLLLAFYRVISEGRLRKRSFSARVISGQGRGSRLGYPTINLDKLDLDIAYGIYLISVNIEGKIYKGLMHYGFKDTFNEGVSQELLFTETVPNIQNKSVDVLVIKKIRDIKKFNNTKGLQEQIKKDLQYFKNNRD